MNCSIYARKSTDQDVDAQDKSVARQVALARAFATKQGWSVSDDHIYIDDGISGAEFQRRPGFQRMLHDAGVLSGSARSPFKILIVSEQKSLGREMLETGYVIKQLAQAGCDVVEYMHGTSLTPRTAKDKLLSQVQGYSDEDHRVRSSERVHEAFTKYHQSGRCVGGRVFGYRNVDIFDGLDSQGRPRKVRVERVIDPSEAAVVRRIFKLYDEGYGLKRIARLLTSEGAVAPVPYKRKDGLAPVVGWATSTVRAVLTRETYIGIVVWNRTKKRDAWGQWNPIDRPESEWIRTKVPSLKIIPKSLWDRVQARRKEAETHAARFESGRLSGRPPKNATVNLLAGLATCSQCGGGLVVETGGYVRGRYPEYICARHRRNGACPNALRMRVSVVNEAVLSAIEEHALTPEAVESVICLSERDDVAERQATLERERKNIEKRMGRLVSAIESGGAPTAIVVKIREMENQLASIAAEQRSLHPIPRLAPSIIADRLAEWRRLLRSSTTTARTVIQKVIVGRVVFTPHADGLGYDFSAPTRFDRLFSGIVAPKPAWLKDGTRGMYQLGPDDTFDGDYGRLLAAASTSLGWRARTRPNANAHMAPVVSGRLRLAA